MVRVMSHEPLFAWVRRRLQVSHNQNPVQKWSTQNHASRTKKADIRSYLWQGDRPLRTFINPRVLIVTQVVNLLAKENRRACRKNTAPRSGSTASLGFDVYVRSPMRSWTVPRHYEKRWNECPKKRFEKRLICLKQLGFS